ncbi:MAG TPA: hypothetical protein VHK24_09300 [Steroidobacter sp.]|nr:hypothetical protein [Steroidobacter sp.]
MATRATEGAVVLPLAALADVRVVTGPPMIKNENGMLVGYVYADIASAILADGWTTRSDG